MSDTPPPTKPKPGSLRDRIAAFEKPNAAAGKSPPAPPPLRPKPSGAVSWKPKPASPPAETGTFNTGGDGEGPSKSGSGGMSASDAKESIGRGGSLKERMAALQGRGAFGAPAPVATPPMGTGKKWVPPPKPVEEEVVAPAVPERGIEEKGTEDSPKAEGEVEKEKEAASPEGEADPEEEERQRRAAIAARMARLGGARVGMSPPVFGAKPVMKQRPSEDAASVKSVGSEGTPATDASPPTRPPPLPPLPTRPPSPSPRPTTPPPLQTPKTRPPPRPLPPTRRSMQRRWRCPSPRPRAVRRPRARSALCRRCRLYELRWRRRSLHPWTPPKKRCRRKKPPRLLTPSKSKRRSPRPRMPPKKLLLPSSSPRPPPLPPTPPRKTKMSARRKGRRTCS
ncbi:hypothetical protein DFH09DRAFT_1143680 [Mycena vulgaris]|nr:hypothetical protein DFH09DRAFT_1143680 [Mycena vulgaris]